MDKPAAAPRTAGAKARGPYKKSQKTRDAIVKAALTEVMTNGLQKASVEAIARRANVGVGNLYYYFGSKDDLVDQTLVWLADHSLALELETGKAHESYAERLEGRLRGYLSFIRRNPRFVRVFDELLMVRPDLYRQRVNALLAWTRREIEEAAARGEIPPASESEIRIQAHLVLGAFYYIDQLVDGSDGEGCPGDDAIVAAAVGFVSRGLGGRA